MIQFVSFLDSERLCQGVALRDGAVDAAIARTAFMDVLRTKADVKKKGGRQGRLSGMNGSSRSGRLA